MTEFFRSMMITGIVFGGITRLWRVITRSGDLKSRRWRDHKQKIGLGGAILIDRVFRPLFWTALLLFIVGTIGFSIGSAA